MEHLVKKIVVLTFCIAFGLEQVVWPAGYGTGTLPSLLKSASKTVYLSGIEINYDGGLNILWEKSGKSGEISREEKLISMKFFLSALALPDDDLWVNLNVTSDESEILGGDMKFMDIGRVFLEADIQLKRDVKDALMETSLMEDLFELGEVEENLNPRFWIVPGRIEIEASNKTMYITNCRLKVKVEIGPDGDGQSMKNNEARRKLAEGIEEKVIPILNEKVNTGSEYVRLRQAVRAVVAAFWYERHVPENGLFRDIIDKGAVPGLVSEPWSKRRFLDEYLLMYKLGISEDTIGDWDIVGGGVEMTQRSMKDAINEEETDKSLDGLVSENNEPDIRREIDEIIVNQSGQANATVLALITVVALVGLLLPTTVMGMGLPIESVDTATLAYYLAFGLGVGVVGVGIFRVFLGIKRLIEKKKGQKDRKTSDKQQVKLNMPTLPKIDIPEGGIPIEEVALQFKVAQYKKARDDLIKLLEFMWVWYWYRESIPFQGFIFTRESMSYLLSRVYWESFIRAWGREAGLGDEYYNKTDSDGRIVSEQFDVLYDLVKNVSPKVKEHARDLMSMDKVNNQLRLYTLNFSFMLREVLNNLSEDEFLKLAKKKQKEEKWYLRAPRRFFKRYPKVAKWLAIIQILTLISMAILPFTSINTRPTINRSGFPSPGKVVSVLHEIRVDNTAVYLPINVFAIRSVGTEGVIVQVVFGRDNSGELYVSGFSSLYPGDRRVVLELNNEMRLVDEYIHSIKDKEMPYRLTESDPEIQDKKGKLYFSLARRIFNGRSRKEALEISANFTLWHEVGHKVAFLKFPDEESISYSEELADLFSMVKCKYPALPLFHMLIEVSGHEIDVVNAMAEVLNRPFQWNDVEAGNYTSFLRAYYDWVNKSGLLDMSDDELRDFAVEVYSKVVTERTGNPYKLTKRSPASRSDELNIVFSTKDGRWELKKKEGVIDVDNNIARAGKESVARIYQISNGEWGVITNKGHVLIGQTIELLSKQSILNNTAEGEGYKELIGYVYSYAYERGKPPTVIAFDRKEGVNLFGFSETGQGIVGFDSKLAKSRPDTPYAKAYAALTMHEALERLQQKGIRIDLSDGLSEITITFSDSQKSSVKLTEPSAIGLAMQAKKAMDRGDKDAVRHYLARAVVRQLMPEADRLLSLYIGYEVGNFLQKMAWEEAVKNGLPEGVLAIIADSYKGDFFELDSYVGQALKEAVIEAKEKRDASHIIKFIERNITGKIDMQDRLRLDVEEILEKLKMGELNIDGAMLLIIDSIRRRNVMPDAIWDEDAQGKFEFLQRLCSITPLLAYRIAAGENSMDILNPDISWDRLSNVLNNRPGIKNLMLNRPEEKKGGIIFSTLVFEPVAVFYR